MATLLQDRSPSASPLQSPSPSMKGPPMRGSGSVPSGLGPNSGSSGNLAGLPPPAPTGVLLPPVTA